MNNFIQIERSTEMKFFETNHDLEEIRLLREALSDALDLVALQKQIIDKLERQLAPDKLRELSIDSWGIDERNSQAKVLKMPQ